ncbi:hypothetical protein WJX73_000305 [Symbiochloris irregularis]|uniref:Uncharacterized protein n=1 Tax=Symbiochloris irregularis TaxID=706552 RepID=A0AAW1NTZ9_9CHLO
MSYTRQPGRAVPEGVVHRQAQVRPPDFGQLIRDFRPHKRPRLMAGVVLWLFGLSCMFLLPAPHSVGPEAIQRFEAKIQEADNMGPQRAKAHQQWLEAQMAVGDAKHWFWWFNSEQRAVVKERKREEVVFAKKAQKLNQQREKTLHQAKAELGLWSEVGIDEGRSLFWGAFERGKVFGRQQTLWDGIMSLFAMQDRNLVGAIIQLVCSAVINFSIGAFLSIFVFLFSLPGLLMSYQAGIFSGGAFFFVALLAAASVVVSFVIALWGAGAGAVYTAATLAGPVRLGSSRFHRQHPMHLHRE